MKDSELLQEHKDWLLDFKRWYDKLTPSQKCSVHPPVGSGLSNGLFEKSEGQIVDDFIRYYTSPVNK